VVARWFELWGGGGGGGKIFFQESKLEKKAKFYMFILFIFRHI